MDVEVRTARLRLAETFVIAREASDVVDVAYVMIRHEGVEGHGEAAPISRYGESSDSARAFVEEHAGLIGDDPFALEDIGERLAAVPGEQAAKAALALQKDLTKAQRESAKAARIDPRTISSLQDDWRRGCGRRRRGFGRATSRIAGHGHEDVCLGQFVPGGIEFDAPLSHHGDVIPMGHGLAEPVCDDDDGVSRTGERAEPSKEVVRLWRRQYGRGFVEEQHRRVRGDGFHDLDALLQQIGRAHV